MPDGMNASKRTRSRSERPRAGEVGLRKQTGYLISLRDLDGNSGIAPHGGRVIVPAFLYWIDAMTTHAFTGRIVSGLLLAALIAGCGTTRMTDSQRAATEMLLVSQAADNAVAQIDFSPLNGKTVYLDAGGIEKEVLDRGYLISLVKQQLVAAGALMYDDKTRAEDIVDLRAGGLGTDRHSVLVGTPAVQLPSVLPGIPTNIPEIALMKKSDQRGVAKVAVFAYNRISGRALWQSGTAEATTNVKDTWVLGTGPFSTGTIRKHTELAGEPLPSIPTPFLHHDKPETATGPTAEQFYPNYMTPGPPPVIPAGLLGVTGAAAVGNRPVAR